MAMTVSEFLASLPEGTRFFRLTNDAECHRGYQYRDGVNQLPPNEKFNPSGYCEPGGLYFFTEAQLVKYKNNVAAGHTLKWIRQVSFDHPDVRDARIYKNPDDEKYKCDKFFLGERKEFFIDDFFTVTNENLWRFEGRHIRWTREMALEAVQHSGCALHYIREEFIDRQMCLIAVSKCSCAFDCVPKIHMDRDMCVAAVQSLWYALEKIPVQFIDRDLCLIAVRYCGSALQYVPYNLRDLDMCLEAVKKTPDAMKHVPEELKALVKEKQQQ